MQIKNNDCWVCYVTEDTHFDEEKVGKWMYFFNDVNFIAPLCEKAVKDGIVKEAKHSNNTNGVACFYLNCDDLEGHK